MDSFLWFTTFLSMMYHSVTVTENANKKIKKKKKHSSNSQSHLLVTELQSCCSCSAVSGKV